MSRGTSRLSVVGPPRVGPPRGRHRSAKPGVCHVGRYTQRATRPWPHARPSRRRDTGAAIAGSARMEEAPGASPAVSREPGGDRGPRAGPAQPRRRRRGHGRHARTPRRRGHRGRQRVGPDPGPAARSAGRSRRSIRPCTRGSWPGATSRSSWPSWKPRASGRSTSSSSTSSRSRPRSAPGWSASRKRSR